MREINIIDYEGNSKMVYLVSKIFLEEYNSIYYAYSEDEINDEKNIIRFAKASHENGKTFLNTIYDTEELNALKAKFRSELSYE